MLPIQKGRTIAQLHRARMKVLSEDMKLLSQMKNAHYWAQMKKRNAPVRAVSEESNKASVVEVLNQSLQSVQMKPDEIAKEVDQSADENNGQYQRFKLGSSQGEEKNAGQRAEEIADESTKEDSAQNSEELSVAGQNTISALNANGDSRPIEEYFGKNLTAYTDEDSEEIGELDDKLLCSIGTTCTSNEKSTSHYFKSPDKLSSNFHEAQLHQGTQGLLNIPTANIVPQIQCTPSSDKPPGMQNSSTETTSHISQEPLRLSGTSSNGSGSKEISNLQSVASGTVTQTQLKPQQHTTHNPGGRGHGNVNPPKVGASNPTATKYPKRSLQFPWILRPNVVVNGSKSFSALELMTRVSVNRKKRNEIIARQRLETGPSRKTIPKVRNGFKSARNVFPSPILNLPSSNTQRQYYRSQDEGFTQPTKKIRFDFRNIIMSSTVIKQQINVMATKLYATKMYPPGAGNVFCAPNPHFPCPPENAKANECLKGVSQKPKEVLNTPRNRSYSISKSVHINTPNIPIKTAEDFHYRKDKCESDEGEAHIIYQNPEVYGYSDTTLSEVSSYFNVENNKDNNSDAANTEGLNLLRNSYLSPPNGGDSATQCISRWDKYREDM